MTLKTSTCSTHYNNKLNQPAVNNNPPNGVIAPNFFWLVNTNKYKDPENNKVPPIKQ